MRTWQDDLGVDIFTKSEAKTGYVLGGGWEYKFAPGWSFKAEYQYLNFGKSIPVNAAGENWNVFHGTNEMNYEDNDFHTVRIGFNYQFGRYDRPLK